MQLVVKKRGRPKAAEKKKPDITNEKIAELIRAGWSSFALCREFSVGHVRINEIREGMESPIEETPV
jgi:hypothetical protein